MCLKTVFKTKYIVFGNTGPYSNTNQLRQWFKNKKTSRYWS